ncbi:MAG TPA: hypothetical protein ENI04_01360 [Candidatus Wildermuthbacteria bacterium]|nr:hypothetical protein [Candidatus Wildermuthbacteria bacterium]
MNNALYLIILILGVLTAVGLSATINPYLDPSQYTIVKIDGEIVLGILTFLLAFLIATATIAYKFVTIHFDERNEKSFEKERKILGAQMNINMGVMHMRIFRTTYHGVRRGSKNGKLAYEEIKEAIVSTRDAQDKIAGLEIDDTMRETALIKNNLAYYLARKWEYLRDKKSNSQFKKDLEKKPEDGREYLADKETAESSLRFFKENEIKNPLLNLRAEFHVEKLTDVRQAVKDSFQVEPTIKRKDP